MPAYRSAPDRGSVTAEAAVLLPVLLAVLAAAVWVLAALSAQLRCVDAARAGARDAARGETSQVVRETARRLAPPGAVVVALPGDGTVEVTVTAQVHPFGSVLRVLPAVTVSGRATASVEQESS